jgi:squalene synthase HpnC
LQLIVHSLENDEVAGGSSGTDRAGVREHVRPAVTRAEEVAANASGENFPVALRLLPERYRRHLTALYCFARLTDDLGDQAREAGQDDAGLRLRLLDELTADVHRIYKGTTPQSPVMQQMAVTVGGCAIPARPLLDLIQANRQDQQVTRYRTFAELAQYCELSANPVGQMVLYIFGAATPERLTLSDHICTALQLAEHWQDVAEDYRAGRIYLPGADLAEYGVAEADLAAPAASPRLLGLMTFETKRAAELLDSGAPLVGTLRGTARLAVGGYVAGGRAALDSIAGVGYDVLAHQAAPGKAALAARLLRTVVTGR